jgi:hypothetical protein
MDLPWGGAVIDQAEGRFLIYSRPPLLHQTTARLLQPAWRPTEKRRQGRRWWSSRRASRPARPLNPAARSTGQSTTRSDLAQIDGEVES